MNIPVFDAKTGKLCYLFKFNIPRERPWFYLDLTPLDCLHEPQKFVRFRIELKTLALGPNNVHSQAVVADPALLQALDRYAEQGAHPYIQRLL